MSRLIDAEVLENFISKKGCIVGDDHRLLVANYDADKWDEVLPKIETAFDLDAAIAELEKLKNEYILKEQTLDLAIKIILDKKNTSS